MTQNPIFEDDGPVILMPDDFEAERWVVKLTNKENKNESWNCMIKKSITIGRDRQNDIAFPKSYDISISRLQCRIRRDLNNRFCISNEEYRGKANNPMLINGERLEKGDAKQIENGDEIAMGRHIFTIEFEQIEQGG
ncbi:MAG: FHA domain-containing protein [Lachnospiraceae bacterium]|nr:FHA domain-containing protein [Lachnospiraceae bacterium]